VASPWPAGQSDRLLSNDRNTSEPIARRHWWHRVTQAESDRQATYGSDKAIELISQAAAFDAARPLSDNWHGAPASQLA